MPVPLIPVIIGLSTMTVTGLAAGVHGVRNLHTAHNRQARAMREHNLVLDTLRAEHDRTDRAVRSYGRYQLRVQRDTLGAFAQWLEDNDRKVRQLAGASVDGVEVQVHDVPELKADALQAANLLGGSVTAAMTGIAARQAALAGVRAAATASTGTAISGLSGVAAQNATLAWWGGGTLAAGGGGVAAGGAVLTGVAAAPAVFLTGLSLSAQGAKALTRAREAQAAVNIDVARIQTDIALLDRLDRCTAEVRSVLKQLDERAQTALGNLAAVDFDPGEHARLFMSCAQLMRALREVLSTPLVDEVGQVSTASKTIVVKYREFMPDKTATAVAGHSN